MIFFIFVFMSDSTHYVRTSFDPVQHGFEFGNGFLNTVLDMRIPKLTPGFILNWLSNQGAEITTKSDGKEYLQVHARGRCGGMAFASLDYYFNNLTVPHCPPAELSPEGVPYDEHPLAKYIHKRLFDSFLKESAFRFVSWTIHDDDPNLLFKGVRHWTRHEQFDELKQSIDAGKPVPLGLVGATNLFDIGGKNHQVVAYGYGYDAETEKMSVLIYDNNYPQRECIVYASPEDKLFKQSIPDASPYYWRGFFVQDYTPILPTV